MEHKTACNIVLYGISPKTCDTVKKACQWLDEKQIPYRFHDYRREGLDCALLNRFMAQLGVKALLNTRSTTWRNLDTACREQATSPEGAARLMLTHPTLIKRPLLQVNDHLLAGFDADSYTRLFAEVCR